MSLMWVLIVASAASILTSTAGALALSKGPSTAWSVVMFAGMAASYLAIGGLVAYLYTTTGKLYPILALVPVAMTVAALRAYKQSRTPDSGSK